MLWNVPAPARTPRVASWTVAAGIGVALALACNSLTGADDVSYLECVPNELRSCACTAVLTGVQDCRDDGSGFSACSCPINTGTGGTGGSGAVPRSGTGGGGTGGSGTGGSSASLTAAAGGAPAASNGGSAACPATSFAQDGTCHQDAIQVAAGFFHDCALLRDGTVRCWGDNDEGQLGDGTVENSDLPVLVVGLNGVRQLALGDDHSCALGDDGTVRCWGKNDTYQLGNDTTTSATTPVAVSGLARAVGISASGAHTCAVLNGGGVRCWGVGSSTSTAVTGLTGVATQVATADRTACALLASGAVQCWSEASADDAIEAGGVVAVRAGAAHFCTLLSAGTVHCWGYNAHGQVGNGTSTDVVTPATVTGLSSVATLELGAYHSCAVVQGTVRCWGEGELGNETDGARTPLTVPGLSGVAALAGGVYHTCALLDDGSVRCWGDVPGSFAVGPIPTPVPGW